MQQWNHWLTQYPGTSVLEAEQKLISSLLSKINVNNILVIGVPEQYKLIKGIPAKNKVVLSPLINKHKAIKYIECGFAELSILPGSMDAVIIPHTLELIDTGRNLITEACRSVKPGGDIIIFGFNLFSLWGVKKWWEKNEGVPWSGHFLMPGQIMQWLDLEDFQFFRKDMIMFRSPFGKQKAQDKFSALEWLGFKTNAFYGGIYSLNAKANVVPLTPIKFHWEQTLSRLSATIPGPTVVREIQ